MLVVLVVVCGLGCKKGRGILGAVAYKERREDERGLSSLSHVGNLGYVGGHLSHLGYASVSRCVLFVCCMLYVVCCMLYAVCKVVVKWYVYTR